MKKLIIILILTCLVSCQNYTQADNETVRDYILGKIELSDKQIKKYDLNKDSQVNILDYLLIRKKLLK